MDDQSGMNFNDEKTPEPKEKKTKIDHAYVNERIEVYTNSFTIHGLTRVLTCARFEAILWLLMLAVGVLLAVGIFHNLLVKYFQFLVFTEVKSVLTNANPLPSLTICEKELFERSYYAYCAHQEEGEVFCHRATNQHHLTAENHSRFFNGKIWDNGIFSVNVCMGWEKGNKSNCMTDMVIKSHPQFNHSCITWNYLGNFSDSYGHIDLTFKFLRPDLLTRNSGPNVIVIPHDPNNTEVDLSKKISIDPKKILEIKVKKMEIIRKPAPYPSKCFNKDTFREKDILPGAYSRRTCLETYKILKAFRECGDVYDYMRDFIPPEIRKKYERKTKIAEAKKCIENIFTKEPPIETCPFPCYELDLNTFSTVSQNNHVVNRTYKLELQLSNIDSYNIMEEIPLYSIQQMLCDTGGFLGLIIGASSLSFIELFIFISLYFIKKWKTFKKE